MPFVFLPRTTIKSIRIQPAEIQCWHSGFGRSLGVLLPHLLVLPVGSLGGAAWQQALVLQVEIDLAKGEARHKEAILKVKEEARVELDTERQKQQELITKYQRDHEELQKKVCNTREKCCVAVDDVNLWKTICKGMKCVCSPAS